MSKSGFSWCQTTALIFCHTVLRWFSIYLWEKSCKKWLNRPYPMLWVCVNRKCFRFTLFWTNYIDLFNFWFSILDQSTETGHETLEEAADKSRFFKVRCKSEWQEYHVLVAHRKYFCTNIVASCHFPLICNWWEMS